MLVDTDILIWYMRGNDRARRLLREHPQFSISAVTYMELVQGMRDKEELRHLRHALRQWRVPVLPITAEISSRAMTYVEEHFLSHSMQLADALIAATAVDQGLPLATGNAKHYRPVTELILVPFRS